MMRERQMTKRWVQDARQGRLDVYLVVLRYLGRTPTQSRPRMTPSFNLSAFLPAVQPPKSSRRLRKRRPNPPPPNSTCRPMPKCLDDRPTLEVSLSAMFRRKSVLKYRRHAIGCEDDGSWVCVEAPAVVSSGC